MTDYTSFRSQRPLGATPFGPELGLLGGQSPILTSRKVYNAQVCRRRSPRSRPCHDLYITCSLATSQHT